MNTSKKYVIVGNGIRSNMFFHYLCDAARGHGHQLVGFCDVNPGRMAYYNRLRADQYNLPPVATADPDGFEQLLADQQADGVIVVSIDRTHDEYIVRAMEAGCDVITEKPMTTTAEKCARILEARKRTGREVTVTFNYRYAPRNSKVKELLMEGVIGAVHSIHFEWLLDTKHGADYFRRWHRDKRNSGGLMVHKSTHHFDLVNWWLASEPETVMAMGRLAFYGRTNAEARGVRAFYHRSTGNPLAATDPFALDMATNQELRELYLNNEQHDGYIRDLSVFEDGISIEDDIGVLVRYANKAVMTYHLNAYAPWEGFRVMFNGERGRLEYEVVETPYVSGAEEDHNLLHNVAGKSKTPAPVQENVSIRVRRHWQPPENVEIEKTREGGHGGGDRRLLDDIFIGGQSDPLGRAAGYLEGAQSIMVGIAANQSMATGLPVTVPRLWASG